MIEGKFGSRSVRMMALTVVGVVASEERVNDNEIQDGNNDRKSAGKGLN